MNEKNNGGIRHAALRAMELRARSDEGTGELYIEGYFSVFNSPYRFSIFGYRCEEVVMPGAFSGVLHDDVRALTNHDTSQVLGRTSAGTLELREDDRGLWGRIRINPSDADAMNLYARVQRRDVDQCSFGFDGESTDETRVNLPDGTIRWEINRVNTLYEVSVCTFPAYEDTSVSARKAELRTVQQRETEVWREAQRKKLHPSPAGE